MKRLFCIMTWMIVSITCCGARGFCSVGTDISSLICNGVIRINAAYAFTHKWSVEVEAGLNINSYLENSLEENMHWGLLYGSEAEKTRPSFRESITETVACFCYWPEETFKGFSIMVGGSIKERNRPDIKTGAGYSCHLWKGMRLQIGYSLRIIESIRDNNLSPEGIKIIISYVF